MIGVAQNDGGVDVVSQLLLGNGLHASHRTHRHENGGFDATMIRFHHSGPGSRMRIGMGALKGKCRHVGKVRRGSGKSSIVESFFEEMFFPL